MLGANSDCQPILTAKGVADYVCKYITKYGAGMSVNARVASLLDDIISRVPEGRTMTVAPLLAKAFIATAVPDSLCCLEAWHILWGLPRTVASRYFRGLNMDGLTFDPRGLGGFKRQRWSMVCTVLGLSETKTGNKLFKLTHMIVCFSMISGTMKRCL